MIFIAHKREIIGIASKGEIIGTAPKREIIGTAPKREIIGVAPKREMIGIAPKREIIIIIVLACLSISQAIQDKLECFIGIGKFPLSKDHFHLAVKVVFKFLVIIFCMS